MTSIRGLENRIRDAFSIIKEDMAVLKNSFLAQKDKNSEFEKKIDVLDGRISNLRDDINELNRNIKDLAGTKEDVGEIHDLKKEVEGVIKDLKSIRKDIKEKPKKKEEVEEVEEVEEIGEKRDSLRIVFWILLIALIIAVSLGLYYDLYGIFNGQSEEGFFKVLKVKEGDLVALDVIAEDKDNDNLFITYSGPLNSDGEWQTEQGDKGEYSVTVSVSDGKEIVSENLKIIVE